MPRTPSMQALSYSAAIKTRMVSRTLQAATAVADPWGNYPGQ